MKALMLLAALSVATFAVANDTTYVVSPNKLTEVCVVLNDEGELSYSVKHLGNIILEPSPLGLKTNIGDFDKGLKLIKSETICVNGGYKAVERLKRSADRYLREGRMFYFQNPEGLTFSLQFELDDNTVGFRYCIERQKGTGSIVINKELTGFRLPQKTTAFITPQSDAMIGWKRTKPSYEEDYLFDVPIDTRSKYDHGWTFPALFKVGNDGWALVSETGVDSHYCASRLSDSEGGLFRLEFPMPEENNGNGTVEPAFALPGNTPWRIIVLGKTLKPIVETTAPWNFVKPLYDSEYQYPFGKGTWSWILWQDESINYDDQVKFIDLAHEMGFQFTLIDNWWDTKIGVIRMERLIKYAHSKNVEPIIWYSSSGYWNDIEQGPVNIMCDPISRKREMKWLQENGVRGIKVDFFGGDKQETMRLYEAILSDADDHGIMVIFHGCTLPRGWELMYPNYVGSEAVLASENMIFSQDFCDREAQNACLHPFVRNAVGCMEYGGCFLNRRMSRSNERGNIRRTTDVFQLATTILFQNPIQHIAIAPNNLTDAPAYCLDFLREVPTTWDDTRFIDGYPGRYVVIARRHGTQWYIAGVSASDKDISVDLDIPAEAKDLYLLADNKAEKQTVKTKNGKYRATIKPQGGFIIAFKME
ncbi:MAG: glycoside hydrolase family 97 catalytic domain-containing protein [Bacteroidales bacterium]|nr:glycoside hydrolase family 97 catalytic domain-containing protein [Bacteroidales bacterium]